MTLKSCERSLAKFCCSKAFDPASVVEEVRQAAETHALEIKVHSEAPPPELPLDAPEMLKLKCIVGGSARVMGLGTAASEYFRLAPTLIFGPGDLDDAHKPGEGVELAQLFAAETACRRMATRWCGR